MSLSSEVVANSLLKSVLILVQVFWAAVSLRCRTVDESHSSASPRRQSQKFAKVVVSFQSFETLHSSILEMNSCAVTVSLAFSPKNSGILRFPASAWHLCWPEFAEPIVQPLFELPGWWLRSGSGFGSEHCSEHCYQSHRQRVVVLPWCVMNLVWILFKKKETCRMCRTCSTSALSLQILLRKSAVS
jgi:hypothetical protein